MLYFTKRTRDPTYKINELTETWFIHNFKNLSTAFIFKCFIFSLHDCNQVKDKC